MRLPRVYALVDGALLARRNVGPVAAAHALLDGGIRLVQFRWKEHYSRETWEAARAIALACRAAGATLVINDRADVARLLDAGLHVGQDDLPPASAREILGQARLLGLSTHNEAQLRQASAEPVDYIALGPVFPTSTKDKPDPVVGREELARLCPGCTKPLVAIGGITLETAEAVWDAGAASVAVAGALYPEGATPASITQRAREWTDLANGYDRRASR